MDRIRLGVVGCGDIAFRSYLPAIRNMAQRVELAAVCDTDPTRAERARAEYGAALASPTRRSVASAAIGSHQALLDVEGLLVPGAPTDAANPSAIGAGIAGRDADSGGKNPWRPLGGHAVLGAGAGLER